VVANALPLPGDHGTGLDECQGGMPARPEPRKSRPEQVIGAPESRASDGLLIDGKLMP
jgi:hypothetical protein